ncbi:vitamin K epoxide reductase family protein [Nonomuraea sp. NPDC059194]|uniref:vitamin K epoxide reductase family protein n=1 Tax=Nonomuraea sp. NPDC059194 TaxID=3346764 RepID=UPI0036875877
MQHSPAEVAARSTDGTAAGHDDPYPQLLPRLLLVGGVLGLGAAFVLAVEKIALLKNPAYVPSCSINPVLSCGSVMSTPQAEAFGFPNPLLGIAAFAVVATIGAAILAGARFQRWFWRGLQAGVTFGVVFVHWLVYQSLYVIGALCPYCMVVWAVTIPIFWYVSLHNFRRYGPVRALSGYHTVVLTVWFLAIVSMIGIRFWPYWSTLI